MRNLVIFAILPLILLGGLLTGPVASGVLTLNPSSDNGRVLDALLLGSVGVVVTSKDEIELKTADGFVTVAILPGSVGSKIVFVSYRDGNSEIYTMNSDGTGLVNLTNDAAQDSGPAWSPDGSSIVFASSRTGSWELYVMDADASGVI